MGPPELATLLLARRRLAARLGWTPAPLAAHRAAALRALRAHAYAHSRFYRNLHAGLTDTPLGELPVLTKADLMANFDALVTDPAVRLADVERHLESASATDRYLGRYRVAATGGTSGRRGVFLADPAEWIQILASYGRSYAWAGLPVGLTHPLRMAITQPLIRYELTDRVRFAPRGGGGPRPVLECHRRGGGADRRRAAPPGRGRAGGPRSPQRVPRRPRADRRLKRETDKPMRSHGSISLNRAPLAAGLVNSLEATVFSAITGRAGYAALLQDGPEFDLDLVESTVLDGAR